MYYVLIIGLFNIVFTLSILNRGGIRLNLVSAPVILNLFVIMYMVFGFELYYGGEYYVFGSDFGVHLDTIYIVSSVFTVMFTASFLFFRKINRINDSARKQHTVSSEFLIVYSALLFLYVFLSLAFGAVRAFPLHNLMLILFNSLAPIIGYSIITKVRFSKVIAVIYIGISIYLGFRYRLVLFFLPILFYYFVVNNFSVVKFIKYLAVGIIVVSLVAIVGGSRVYSSGLDLDRLAGISYLDLLVGGIFNDTSTVLVSGAVIDYIENIDGFSYAMQIYYIIIYFIPSFFLENKEYSPIFKYVSAVTGQFSNESGAAVLGFAEYYHTAGYTGVVFIAALFGFIFSRFHRLSEDLNPYRLFIYFVFVACFVNSLTRGYFPQNAQDLLSLIIGIWLIRKRLSSKKILTMVH